MGELIENLKFFVAMFVLVTLASCAVWLFTNGQLVLGAAVTAGVFTFMAWISR